ncbi:hypothetical protein, partial [Streptomyces sp. P17]|uniref:hypothetical protein n=1 Tax=Streptomyces sp. P17 TaxID=3074716 RepID=UPI0028F44217
RSVDGFRCAQPIYELNRSVIVMTLVVAHAEPDICFMVGDTLLSHEHFTLKGDIGPVNGEFHSLKIQIVTGELAIGFAGNFDTAE